MVTSHGMPATVPRCMLWQKNVRDPVSCPGSFAYMYLVLTWYMSN